MTFWSQFAAFFGPLPATASVARSLQAAMKRTARMASPARILSFDVGTRNFALCLVQRDPLAILEWEVIDTVDEGRAPAKGTIEEKKRALLRCLETRRERLCSQLCAGDAVVIEQQPFGRGTGSPTMNILAHVIGTFFVLAAPHAEPMYDVRQVAARTKLAVDPVDFGGRPVPGQGAPAAPPSSTAWHCTGAQLEPHAVESLTYSATVDGSGYVVFKNARRAPGAVARILHTAASRVRPVGIGEVPVAACRCGRNGVHPAAAGGTKKAPRRARATSTTSARRCVQSILEQCDNLAPCARAFRAVKKSKTIWPTHLFRPCHSCRNRRD